MRRPSWNKFKTDRRKSVFLTLFISYVIILLLPVILGSVLYTNIEAIMIRNANRSNAEMLDQAKRIIDIQMEEVDHLTMQISINPKLQWLLEEKPGPNMQSNLYKFIDFVRDLSRYSISSEFINNFYVYFFNTDTILSPTMKTDSKTFYDEIYHYTHLTYEQYQQNILLPYHYQTFLPSEKVNSEGKSYRMITYAQSLPVGERGDISGSIVMLINEEQIEGMLANIEGIQNGDIYILNRSGQILMGNSQDQAAVESVHKLIKNELAPGKIISAGNSIKFTGSDSSNMITYTTSSKNGWTYISVVPKSAVLAQVHTLKLKALLIFLGCLVGGGIICYYMAYRNYRPILEVVNALIGGGGNVRKSERNEFEFIKERVSDLFDKEKNLTMTLSRNMPIIQSDFLLRLIRGYVDTTMLPKSDLEFMNLKFEKDYFAVIIIHIDDCNQFIKKDTEREWTLIRFILKNLTSELLQQVGYPIELERDRMILLINLPESSKEQCKELQEFANQLKYIMDEKFKTLITIAVSMIHHGMGSIAQCYSEASFAMDYKMIEGQSSVLYYEEVHKWNQPTYHYPMETEVQLTNYVRNGDFINAERIINQIYEINFRTRSMTPEMAKCLFFDLLSTLFKLVGSLNIAQNLLFAQEHNPVKMISDCETAEEMNERTKYFYQVVCERLGTERTEHSERLYKQIVEYVERNYHDSMLSLTVIAEHLGLNSSSYVSTFFKKYSGQNLIDYITNIRIHEAKRLLAETSLTIMNITEKVGYSTNIGFTRTFKKVEGVTPGQYREMLKKSD